MAAKKNKKRKTIVIPPDKIAKMVVDIEGVTPLIVHKIPEKIRDRIYYAKYCGGIQICGHCHGRGERGTFQVKSVRDL